MGSTCTEPNETDDSLRAVTCGRCGRTESTPPLTWSHQVGPRGAEWLCDACTRENIRAIEGKIDEPWW